jgi:hypothetical protein
MVGGVMKKILCLAVSLMIAAIAHATDDVVVSVEQLPSPVKMFVTQYFPKQKISSALLDTDFIVSKYELRLDNGTEIEITSKGEWRDIDCKKNPMPSSLIPNAIARYVKNNANGATIREIKSKKYGYEIELSNGQERKFNKRCGLIDDDD